MHTELYPTLRCDTDRIAGRTGQCSPACAILGSERLNAAVEPFASALLDSFLALALLSAAAGRMLIAAFANRWPAKKGKK